MNEQVLTSTPPQSPIPEIKQSHKKRYILIVLLVLILITVASIFVYTVQKKSPVSEGPPVVKKTDIKNSETKTYINNIAGYRFIYPKSWDLQEIQDQACSLRLTPTKLPDAYYISVEICSLDIPGQTITENFLSADAKVTLLKKESIKINAHDGLRIEKNEDTGHIETVNAVYFGGIQQLMKQPDDTYAYKPQTLFLTLRVISIGEKQSPLYEAYKPLFNQLVSSFSFLALRAPAGTEQWNIYKTQDNSLLFRYPKRLVRNSPAHAYAFYTLGNMNDHQILGGYIATETAHFVPEYKRNTDYVSDPGERYDGFVLIKTNSSMQSLESYVQNAIGKNALANAKVHYIISNDKKAAVLTDFADPLTTLYVLHAGNESYLEFTRFETVKGSFEKEFNMVLSSLKFAQELTQ